uniref:Si:ch73-335m24.2 n=1 Tax=Scophthalmus maximus TaxID=52904 RepID=A0A8D3E2J4_SCOMX
FCLRHHYCVHCSVSLHLTLGKLHTQKHAHAHTHGGGGWGAITGSTHGRGDLFECLILKNHTAHACEGGTLAIECPSRTSVAVLSAFYGRRVPNRTFSRPLQKVLSECQDRRSCHIPVFSPVFGQDPCPLTSKYLLVSYKCRPGRPLTC